MSEHTPTPWRLPKVPAEAPDATIVCDADGGSIADCTPAGPWIPEEQAEANAAFIVRAVNSHDALVKAIHDYLAVFDRCGGSESVSAQEFADARAAMGAALAAVKDAE